MPTSQHASQVLVIEHALLIIAGISLVIGFQFLFRALPFIYLMFKLRYLLIVASLGHFMAPTLMMMLGVYPPTHRPQCTAQYTAPLYVTVALRHWLVHQPLRHKNCDWLFPMHHTSFTLRHLSCIICHAYGSIHVL